MDYPRIVYNEENNKNELFDVYEVVEIIKNIEIYDGKDIAFKIIVESLAEDLLKISNGLLNVRIWCIKDILHCAVIYSNEYVKGMIYEFY